MRKKSAVGWGMGICEGLERGGLGVNATGGGAAIRLRMTGMKDTRR